MSNKVRVYELAKESGLHNREVLRRLEDLGIEAKSHSSSVADADAARFRDSLGRSEDDRKSDDDARRKREQDELERYRAMATPAAPESKKAAKVLPPHLRQQQVAEEATAEVPAGTTASPAASADTPTAATVTPEASAPEASTAASDAAAAAMRMPGAPPPRLKPGEAPMRPATRVAPPVTTPPPSAEPGQAVGEKRPSAKGLPQEGTGRRAVPPPLRKAPPRPQAPAGAPRQGAGAPSSARPQRAAGDAGKPRTPSSPYRQSPATRGPQGLGGGPGGAPSGGPGAPGGAPAGTGKSRKKKKRERTSPEEQEVQQRGPLRRDIPLEDQITIERVEVVSGVTVGELADKLGVAGAALVKKVFEMGEMATVQQTLPDDTVEIICADLSVEVYFLSEEELEFGVETPDIDADLVSRPPIITVMGHVDHGKTLLLDAIRLTDVVSTEAGGITQHIGAYQISNGDRRITFIDTPGHEAFTAMRARGAQITDVAILVVAANDGVMPQTREAIAHAKAAQVPIVVAINKMDVEGADPTKVMAQLTEVDVVAESFGGDVPMVQVSAKTRQGLDELLEVVLLQADLLELTANPSKQARGRVVEAHLDRGRGPIATLLVQGGTLHRGDVLVAGTADGKIRAMFDENGNTIDVAEPARPVQVVGLTEVPEAGDEFRVVDAERLARDVAQRRSARERRKELAERRPSTLEEFTSAVQAGGKAVLNVIIKADVSGSAEALEDALLKLELEEVQVRVLSKGVGAISQGDVRLAEASDAIIVAFNVRPGANAREEIERTGVDVRTYRIIYEAIEDIQAAVKGLRAPEFREEILGEAQVREVFKTPRGFVFGCMVTRGEVQRDAGVRVIREGVVVAEDTMSSLRRFKDDVREVREGFECGIGLDKFQDVKEGDVIEAFRSVEVARD
ncbi:MAG: translation initiation factor IF-2 [Nitriliruptoraceae bacterium]